MTTQTSTVAMLQHALSVLTQGEVDQVVARVWGHRVFTDISFALARAAEEKEQGGVRAPAGFTLLKIVSDYYGSVGDGHDEEFWFAIPEGVAVPEIRLSHGSYGNNRSEEMGKLPPGSLFWDDPEWVNVRSYLEG